jgi:signal transduction histidine kinase
MGASTPRVETVLYRIVQESLTNAAVARSAALGASAFG